MFGIDLKPYPVKVILVKKRGDKNYIMGDKARRDIRPDRTQAYKLKKEKHLFSPPPFEFFYTGPKGNPMLFVYSPDDGVYVPMKVDNPSGLKVPNKELLNWFVQETERLYNTYKPKESFWAKWGALIGIGFMIAALALTYILLGETWTNIAGSAAQAAGSIERAAELLAQIPPLQ